MCYKWWGISSLKFLLSRCPVPPHASLPTIKPAGCSSCPACPRVLSLVLPVCLLTCHNLQSSFCPLFYLTTEVFISRPTSLIQPQGHASNCLQDASSWVSHRLQKFIMSKSDLIILPFKSIPNQMNCITVLGWPNLGSSVLPLTLSLFFTPWIHLVHHPQWFNLPNSSWICPLLSIANPLWKFSPFP